MPSFSCAVTFSNSSGSAFFPRPGLKNFLQAMPFVASVRQNESIFVPVLNSVVRMPDPAPSPIQPSRMTFFSSPSISSMVLTAPATPRPKTRFPAAGMTTGVPYAAAFPAVERAPAVVFFAFVGAGCFFCCAARATFSAWRSCRSAERYAGVFFVLPTGTGGASSAARQVTSQENPKSPLMFFCSCAATSWARKISPLSSPPTSSTSLLPSMFS